MTALSFSLGLKMKGKLRTRVLYSSVDKFLSELQGNERLY